MPPIVTETEDIYAKAIANAETDVEGRKMVQEHFAAQRTHNAINSSTKKSTLFELQANGLAGVHAVFGGQGNSTTCLEELRVLYSTYMPFVKDTVAAASILLQELSRDPRIKDQFPRGFDVLGWLRNPYLAPLPDYLISAPISFPLIGLLQLVHVKAVIGALGCTTADIPDLFQSLAGHSQGVVIAAVVATAHDWAGFQDAVHEGLTILFWIGARCQQIFRDRDLSEDRMRELKGRGYGTPSPMLAVSNTSRCELDNVIGLVNSFLDAGSHITVSLVNTTTSFVVSGSRRSLTALIALIEDRSAKETAGTEQSRVPFSRRKPVLPAITLVRNPVLIMIEALHAEHMDIEDVLAPSPAYISRICLYDANGLPSLEVTRLGREIQVRAVTNGTNSGSAITLDMIFRYQPETPYALIHEVVKGRNERICNMYRQLWLGSDASPGVHPILDKRCLSTETFKDGFVVDKARVQLFLDATGLHMYRDQAPMDFAFVAAWKAISRTLLQDPVPGDLLALVHLSNSFKVASRSNGLVVGDRLHISARVAGITINESGKTIEVTCALRQAGSGEDVMTICSRFLFRSKYDDFSNTFTTALSEKYEMVLASDADRAVLKSKQWFNLTGVLGPEKTTLEFHLDSLSRPSDNPHMMFFRTSGSIYDRSEAGELSLVGTVAYSETGDQTNAVLAFLTRHEARSLHKDQRHTRQGNTVPGPSHTIEITMPCSNEPYSRASGDLNPIHTSPVFSALAGLPGTITHGMHCSASVRAALETHVVDGDASRIRQFSVSFTGMVIPGDKLAISFTHTAMQNGLKVIQISVVKSCSEEQVLSGEALVAQPRSALLFTGQGSQEAGMGMELYTTSPASRRIWDRADAHFRARLGLSLLHIVRNNPATVTVHFAGQRGRRLRTNYQNMRYEMPKEGFTEKVASCPLQSCPLFPNIDDTTRSFTHAHPGGLLFATQFAQPALVVMELAAFTDMRANSAVDLESCVFAGHSLGEYAALAAFTDFMRLEPLLDIVFARGMTMQLAVERDFRGISAFGMVAVDPGRVGRGFTAAILADLITHIRDVKYDFFIETVNFNVRDSQYVCAGDLRALDLLQRALDVCHGSEQLPDLADLTVKLAASYDGKLPESVHLIRGSATVPLVGIDVPFHSSLLRTRMAAFRNVLLANLDARQLKPETLVGRYIPNVMGRPFEIGRDYVEAVFQVTKSERVEKLLEQWQERIEGIEAEEVENRGHCWELD